MQGNNILKFKEMMDSAAGIPDLVERSRKYKNIVGSLSQQAVRSNDHQYVDEAMKIAGMVTDDPSKAYVEIIRAIVKMKQKEKNTFDEAVKITERIDNDLDLSVALHEIAVGFGRFSIDKKDDLIYSDSLDLVQKIPLNTYRAMALRNLSKVMAGIDQKRSLDLVDRSIEILENSKGIKTMYHILALCDTGAALSLLDDERSYGFIKRAIGISHDIVDDFEKSAVLLKIVETEMSMGIKLNDNELIKEASLISQGIKKEYYKTLALKVSKK
ncbi:MAG TPA: hypothetical protein VER35_00675 [Candidatus Limnocylindrales bacterium]|nr:hypothetical protein [Candidatus Limnocylindrales bacterium]